MKAVFVYEANQWRALFRWITGRYKQLPEGVEAFGYTRAITPILYAFIGVSAVEIPILHLLLPWETVRLIVDIIGVYSLIWMVSLLAVLRVHPHLVAPDGLTIRNGQSQDLTVPWDQIAAVRHSDRSLAPGKDFREEDTPAGRVLYLGVGKQTNVDLVLRGPTIIELRRGETQPVHQIRIAADEPKALAAAAMTALKATLTRS